MPIVNQSITTWWAMILAKKKSNNYILPENRNLEDENFRYDLRGQVYYKEMPDVIVKLDKQNAIQAQILDISANGIGIYHSSFSEELLNKKIEVIFGDRKTYTLIGTINSFDKLTNSGSGMSRVGIVFESKNLTKINRPKRFNCSKKFPVTAYGEHPFRYNHTLLFHVSDFSFNGMTLIGTVKENLLLPGAVILVNIMLPTVGEFEVLVEITNIRSLNNLNENKKFVIGAVFLNPTSELLVAISSYLILDLEISANVKDLKENGFLIPNVNSSVVFSYVSSQEEWEQVLKLRLRAAQKEGRWLGETDHWKLTDKYDRYSRHIICKVENKIVASARLVFNNKDPQRVEHGHIMEIPAEFWEYGFVEASRLCTDPDYRGSTLFLGFLQHVGRIVGQQNIRYVLMNCEDSLVPVYKKYGGKALGIRFNTEFMQTKNLNVIVCDFKKIYQGKDMGFISWYIVWRDIYLFLSRSNFIKINFLARTKLKIYELIGSIIFGFYNKKKSNESMYKRKDIIDSFRKDNPAV